VAEETDVSQIAEAPEENEALDEAPQAADASEPTEARESEDVEVAEAVEAAGVAAPPSAEEEAPDRVEAVEAHPDEEIEVLGEGEAADEGPSRPEAAEPSEMITDMPDLVDELSLGTDRYYYGTGRRKTASAQVRLYPSKEPAITVNDKPVDQYFPRGTDVVHLKRPLQVTATQDMFRITVKVQGGGISGQAGAIRHGIARALTKANPELRRTLRKEGSLTRDPRMKERKKPGLKRARKAPQYTKR